MTTISSQLMTAANLPNSNYLPIDLNLINNPKYQELPIEALFLHALYTMRMTCSIYNSQKDGSWLDQDGLPYIYFSNEEAADLLKVSERKITNLRNTLAKLDLIKVVRHGLKHYRIYVANPQAPAEDSEVKLAFKNYTTSKQLVSAADFTDTVRPAKSAGTKTQDLQTSTQKQLEKTTRPTNATCAAASKMTDTAPVEKSESLIAGLKARYVHLIPAQVFTRFLPFCEGDYQQAKWYVDTIFKAKFVSNRQFIQAGIPAESDVLTFEGNDYYQQGLADAVAKAVEQMYRYKQVRNPQAFFFSFMKGYFTEKTRQYLVDHYELTPELERTFSCISHVLSTEKWKKIQEIA
ncbi:replication protein [Enterococcus florum]|uniref:Replication protein n=1 Tax=Enterococcus florum TaxID=2480627 RepID=A0A4P5P585_9ENTE|nr:replication initiator protein A [Enterococcus florum]GCF92997.1 replication protein [Enterococcus florum]